MSKRAEVRQKFLAALTKFGGPTVTKEDIANICNSIGISHPYWFTNDDSNRVKRGVYKVPSVQLDTM